MRVSILYIYIYICMYIKLGTGIHIYTDSFLYGSNLHEPVLFLHVYWQPRQHDSVISLDSDDAEAGKIPSRVRVAKMWYCNLCLHCNAFI